MRSHGSRVARDWDAAVAHIQRLDQACRDRGWDGGAVERFEGMEAQLRANIAKLEAWQRALAAEEQGR